MVFTRFVRLTFFSARKSGGGHEAVLNASRGTDEHDFSLILFLKFLCDGKGRDDVSASSASRQDGAHGVNINHSARTERRFLELASCAR